MKIRFINFWSSFDETNNFFIRYFESNGYRPEVIFDKHIHVDLEIVSVFPGLAENLTNKLYSRSKGSNPQILEKLLKRLAGLHTPIRNSRVRLWYTGENIRPPFTEDFDGFLSFEQSKFEANLIYFPLWMTHMNWFSNREENLRLGGDVIMKSLLNNRELKNKKDKFAIVFMSNPHPFRLQIVNELSRIGRVDVFGAYSGNYVSSKIETAKNYQYSICFENDLYPGYVTEKLLEAYLSETVPLYWGDLGSDDIYNQQSFINLRSFNSSYAWIEKIASLDYKSVYEESLFSSEPTLHEFDTIIENLLIDYKID